MLGVNGGSFVVVVVCSVVVIVLLCLNCWLVIFENVLCFVACFVCCDAVVVVV